MRGCVYDYTFIMPNKELKETKKINMENLCSLIKSDLEEYYFIDEININNQVLYNLQKRPQFCSKILKKRIRVVKCVKEREV